MKRIILSLLLYASAAAAVEPSSAVRRDEARLLNQLIPKQYLGSGLRVWDGSSWRPARDAELTRPQAKVLVVNLWATYCKPCLTEFPKLREMARKIEVDYKQDVQFIFLSETSDPAEMKLFCTRNEKILPTRYPFYLDENENIASALRFVQPGGNLSLPTTLILDDQRAVRYAMLGAIVDRRSELVAAIDDVVNVVTGRSQSQ